MIAAVVGSTHDQTPLLGGRSQASQRPVVSVPPYGTFTARSSVL